MSKFQEELLLLLGGVTFAVGGAVGLFYLDGWNFTKAACACLAGTAVTVGMVRCIIRDWRNGSLVPKIVTEKERKQGTELAMFLPYSTLSARFRELKSFDDTIAADEPPGFLGRSEGAPIHIHRAEGEYWLALYWVDDDNYLRDSELAALCRRHKFPMADDYRKLKATGVAFYREGTLALYPAAFEPEFRRHFLDPDALLAPEPEFRRWLTECYGEGEEEE